MKNLKKVFMGILCGAILLTAAGTAFAAENSTKVEVELVKGGMDNKVVIPADNLNKTIGKDPILKNISQAKAGYDISITSMRLYPLGLKDGQLYRFTDLYVQFDLSGFATNEFEGHVSKLIMDDIISRFDVAGFELYGWEQKTNYYIQSPVIPKMLKYFVNNYGTGTPTIINLNSSNNNASGSLSVQYRAPYNSSSQYGAWVFGEYSGMLGSQTSRTEFLASTFFNTPD